MTTKRLQPRKRATQQRAIDTRQRLLEAAARVFSEYGYAAGTTNRIAEAAGHSIGTLYQYFPNKDAILVELATAHATSGIAAVQRQLDGDPLPEMLEDRLRLFIRAAIDNHRGDPALHKVLFEEAPRPPELLTMLHAAEDQAIDAAGILLGGDPRVSVRDIPLAARMVVTSIESLVHRFVTHTPPVDLDSFENELVAMLTHYLTGNSR
ncbi:MAG TPA: TetR/AcrR family transcriptional regulator [Kineosporiaceae bacterium]|nr:TetR/AcrR family transcriptional regulator [Kineosporiaceae bacterium]